MLSRAQVRPSDLRSQLVEAAVRLLRDRGVAALTTRDIAREAGCSDGALYTHFPCKSDLVAAACEERLPDLRRTIGDLVERVGSGSVERNLEKIISATQTFMTELVPLTTAIASDPELRSRHRSRFSGQPTPPQRTIDAVASYIAAEQRIGRVNRHVSPGVVAGMLVAACFAAANVEFVFDQSVHGLTHEAYARSLARALWRGMTPHEGEEP